MIQPIFMPCNHFNHMCDYYVLGVFVRNMERRIHRMNMWHFSIFRLVIRIFRKRRASRLLIDVLTHYKNPKVRFVWVSEVVSSYYYYYAIPVLLPVIVLGHW